MAKSKLSDLQSQLEKASGKTSTAVAPPPEQPLPGYKAPSREGKTHIGGYFPQDVKRSLRLVQAQTGEDTQTILGRALNDLFAAHNVPLIDL